MEGVPFIRQLYYLHTAARPAHAQNVLKKGSNGFGVDSGTRYGLRHWGCLRLVEIEAARLQTKTVREGFTHLLPQERVVGPWQQLFLQSPRHGLQKRSES